MSSVLPTFRSAARPENAGLTFVGEPQRQAARLAASEAQRLLAARNPNGRTNEDVVRRTMSAGQGRLREGWMVDFPPDWHADEAALHEAPFAWLARQSENWRSPHTQPQLRAALAKHERALATPLHGAKPAFAWFEATALPDDSLLVVVRSDDFAHAVLSSRPFALWWRAVRTADQPTLAVDSFPWPWPPTTPLSALSREQEEQRHTLARAARSNDEESRETALAQAYGWPVDLSEAEVLSRLRARA